MSVFPRRVEEAGLTLETAAPMFAVGPGLEIVRWNEAAEALTGFAEADALGRRCWELVRCPEPVRRLHCADCPRPERAAVAAVPAFENEIVTRAGERIWVSVTTVLAGGGCDAPLRVHLLRELKRERQLEELLRQVVTTALRGTPGAPAVAAGEPRGAGTRGVTAREREVVRLLAQGSSTADIAARLGITPRTARNHVQNILCKLRVHSRLEAVAYASARGIV